ncbi:hypothetical protein BX666DRAFT_1939063 [Dichotomocladium elegans]|nr:hypothetical protein BX666DRAFT_1939063 [Dichotomocladium elegans]
MTRFITLTIAALMALTVSVKSSPVGYSHDHAYAELAPADSTARLTAGERQAFVERGDNDSSEPSESTSSNTLPSSDPEAPIVDDEEQAAAVLGGGEGSEDPKGSEVPAATVPAKPADPEDTEDDKKSVPSRKAPVDTDNVEDGNNPGSPAVKTPGNAVNVDDGKKTAAPAPKKPIDPEDAEQEEGGSETQNGSKDTEGNDNPAGVEAED